jgi:peptidoglycan/xylan/chitin deacetylase (PgdA/CDA1 family)
MKTNTFLGFGAAGCLVILAGCDIGDHSALSHQGTSGQGGATSSASSSGSTGSTGTGSGAAPPSVSGLPTPSGSSTVPQPSGAAQGLKVVSWAGFTAAVTYTFDDSQPSQIEHWADLKAEGIRGTFYLNSVNDWASSFVQTWQDAVKSGWEIGNHTVHHCYEDGMCTNGATFTTPAQEFDANTTYIQTTIGQADVWTGAYPFGDTGYEPFAEPRFFVARGIPTSATPQLIMPNDATDPYNLPCVAAVAAGGQPASDFIANVDTAHGAGGWLIFLFHSITPTESANLWYAPTDITSITGSIDHAKSLPDVWIDTLSNVAAYWVGQKLLTTASPSSGGGGTTWTWSLPAHFPSGKYLRVTVDGGHLTQGGQALAWDGHGYYEISLDAGSLTLSP